MTFTPATATSADFNLLTGECNCKSITYTLTAPPLIIHCCHCTWCQRESGSAFALNALIECYNFQITSTVKPTIVKTPSPSGFGQLIARCPDCWIAVYSHYGAGKDVVFVKVGTLSDGSRERVMPSVHIFTSTKMPWFDLSGEKARGVPVFEAFYKRDEVWTKANIERLENLKEWAKEGKDAIDKAL